MGNLLIKLAIFFYSSGGTKTILTMVDENGEIIADLIGGGSNPWVLFTYFDC
jgi:hypothetical protein